MSGRHPTRHPVHRRVAAVVLGAMLAVTSQAVDAGPARGSTWVVPLQSGSSGQAGAQGVPSPPAAVATCSLVSLAITVNWPAIAHASTYDVYMSTSGANGSYALAAAGVTGTSWTSGVLLVGTYYFRVTATLGTTWTTALSPATVGHTITVVLCT